MGTDVAALADLLCLASDSHYALHQAFTLVTAPGRAPPLILLGKAMELAAARPDVAAAATALVDRVRRAFPESFFSPFN